MAYCCTGQQSIYKNIGWPYRDWEKPRASLSVWKFDKKKKFSCILLDGKTFPYPVEPRAMYFYDMNAFKTSDIEKLKAYIIHIKCNDCALIVASSGSIMCTSHILSQVGHNFISNFYEHDQVLMKPFDNTLASTLARSFVPPELVDYVVEQSSGIPGLLSIKAKTQEQYNGKFWNRITKEWEKVVDGIFLQRIDVLETMHLLVATQYEISIYSTKLTMDHVCNLLPVTSHMIYIDNNKVPVLYIQQSKGRLIGILQNIFKE